MEGGRVLGLSGLVVEGNLVRLPEGDCVGQLCGKPYSLLSEGHGCLPESNFVPEAERPKCPR